MRQRVSVITLGVADLGRARSFYEALGWETGAAPGDDVVFFQAGDMVLALWGRAGLAEDSAVEDPGGWGGVTLALNLGSPQEVDDKIGHVNTLDIKVLPDAKRLLVSSDGITYLRDAAGQVKWRLRAHNPHWTLTEDGGVRLS